MTGATPRETVARLRETILEVVRPLLAGVRTTALLEYPEYPNPGDSAIWLGALALLDALGLPPPAYATESRTHDPAALDRALGEDGVVLLQGGGSFGDLWPPMQAFRESVIEAHPAHRILQLPQSLHFEDPAALARTRGVLATHPDLRLLARDAPSLATARDALALGDRARACPDLALLLDVPPARPDLPPRVLWLGRTDREAADAARRDGSEGAGVARDWIDPPRTASYRRLSRRSRRVRRSRRPSPRRRRRLMATYEPVARDRLAFALAVLDQGRVVVTDRLHGHLLCLLRGQPHVLLDNSYGKVRRFHEAWTRGVAGVHFAASAPEAAAMARDLLRRELGA